jgi:hypothetical protein
MRLWRYLGRYLGRFLLTPEVVISSGVKRSREIYLEVDLSAPLRSGRDDGGTKL